MNNDNKVKVTPEKQFLIDTARLIKSFAALLLKFANSKWPDKIK